MEKYNVKISGLNKLNSIQIQTKKNLVQFKIILFYCVYKRIYFKHKFNFKKTTHMTSCHRLTHVRHSKFQ